MSLYLLSGIQKRLKIATRVACVTQDLARGSAHLLTHITTSENVITNNHYLCIITILAYVEHLTLQKRTFQLNRHYQYATIYGEHNNRQCSYFLSKSVEIDTKNEMFNSTLKKKMQIATHLCLFDFRRSKRTWSWLRSDGRRQAGDGYDGCSPRRRRGRRFFANRRELNRDYG